MPQRNADQEKEVLQVKFFNLSSFLPDYNDLSFKWVETVMGEPLPSGDFGEVLKDGVVLCKLMNKLQPGSVKKFKEKVKINLNVRYAIHTNFSIGPSVYVDGKRSVFHQCCQKLWRAGCGNVSHPGLV